MKFLVYFFLAAFIFIYIKRETAYIKKHGVWTIASVTDKFSWFLWLFVYYEFQYDNQTCVYSHEAEIDDMKKINIGNRFFIIVVPGKVCKRRKYDGS